MSEANVEIVRRIYERWATGDFSFRDETFDPAFQWRQPEAVESGVLGDPASITGGLKKVFEVWADFRVVPEHFIDAGERVVVFAQTHGQARGSGVEEDQPSAHVWELRDGRVLSMEVHNDRTEALRAVGLDG